MKLGWLCKHGSVSGEIEIQTSDTLHGMWELAMADHAKKCRIGGQAWLLIDAERIGKISVEEKAIQVEIGNPEDSTLLILLHVQ